MNETIETDATSSEHISTIHSEVRWPSYSDL